MATTNISLGTTQINYVIDYSKLTFTGEKVPTATVNITLPNSETFKNQYRNRILRNVLITTKGTLAANQQVTVNISAVGCNVSYSEQLTFLLQASKKSQLSILLLVQQGDTGWFGFDGITTSSLLEAEEIVR